MCESMKRKQIDTDLNEDTDGALKRQKILEAGWQSKIDEDDDENKEEEFDEEWTRDEEYEDYLEACEEGDEEEDDGEDCPCNNSLAPTSASTTVDATYTDVFKEAPKSIQQRMQQPAYVNVRKLVEQIRHNMKKDMVQFEDDIWEPKKTGVTGNDCSNAMVPYVEQIARLLELPENEYVKLTTAWDLLLELFRLSTGGELGGAGQGDRPSDVPADRLCKKIFLRRILLDSTWDFRKEFTALIYEADLMDVYGIKGIWEETIRAMKVELSDRSWRLPPPTWNYPKKRTLLTYMEKAMLRMSKEMAAIHLQLDGSAHETVRHNVRPLENSDVALEWLRWIEQFSFLFGKTSESLVATWTLLMVLICWSIGPLVYSSLKDGHYSFSAVADRMATAVFEKRYLLERHWDFHFDMYVLQNIVKDHSSSVEHRPLLFPSTLAAMGKRAVWPDGVY